MSAINDAYRELAAHYSAAILPGRVRKPKDEASVENTVGNIATQVNAGLRHRSFQALPHLREAIYERMDEHNTGPVKKRAGSRLSVFETEEKQLLRPLPAVFYEISRWILRAPGPQGRACGVRPQLLFVPCAYVGRRVDLRVTTWCTLTSRSSGASPTVEAGAPWAAPRVRYSAGHGRFRAQDHRLA